MRNNAYMRRAIPVVLACISLAGASVQASASGARPALQIRSLQPFLVRGVHFVPLERVTVTLDGGGARRSRAGTGGSFTTTFPGAAVDPCDVHVVKAVGRKGSVATFRSRPRMCISG